MTSVYEAAQKLAAELKAELTSIQTYLDLHDHFSERFGLKPAASTGSEAEPSEAEAHVAGAHDDEPVAEATVADDAETPKLEAAEAKASELDAPEFEDSETEADESETVEAEALDHDEPVHAVAKDEETKDEPAAEEKPVVIKASEGVLIAATAEAEPVAPLGPAATLQSVAEKLAATINASHPSTVSSAS